MVEKIPVVETQTDYQRLLEAMASGPEGTVRIGMKCKGMNDYYLLTLKNEERVDHMLGEGVHPVLKRLDVKILHSILFEGFLGLCQQDAGKDSSIVYVQGAENAVRMLEEDLLHQAVFFLNPPSVHTVIRVAAAGERMPPKSTYFYPKLLTGLVFRKIDDLDEKD